MGRPLEGTPAPSKRYPPAWLPGVILLAILVVVGVHYGESQHFMELVQRAEPIWLLVAAVLQLATYFATALIFKVGLRRSHSPVRLRSLVPLGLMKLFIDQVVPSAGIGGTVLVIRALGRRGVPVGIYTAVVVVSLLGFYAAYAAAVGICLVILWRSHELSTAVMSLVTIVALMTATVPVTLLWLTRGGAMKVPGWIRRFPGLKPVLEAMADAPPATIHDRKLLLAASALQFAIFLLDAATLRAMLLAIGFSAGIETVFASFVMASVAATISLLPGGVGPFEAVSVGTLRLMGVPIEASITGTVLLRGFTLWLPMLPGLWLARREMGRIRT
jgi:glycosyltransferase 2 family protein